MDYKLHTRTRDRVKENKGKDDKAIYNQKTIRLKEALLEKRKNSATTNNKGKNNDKKFKK